MFAFHFYLLLSDIITVNMYAHNGTVDSELKTYTFRRYEEISIS